MAARVSAGVLLWRRVDPDGVEVLVGHMGGPFWARKHERAWSLPKGELEPGEEPLAAARRELAEELGAAVVAGAGLDGRDWLPLGEVRQSGGKVVHAWAVEADLDPAAVVPGTFTLEWPPRSGRQLEFPELDRVAWVTPDEARKLLVAAQAVLVDRLLEHLAGAAG